MINEKLKSKLKRDNSKQRLGSRNQLVRPGVAVQVKKDEAQEVHMMPAKIMTAQDSAEAKGQVVNIYLD